MYTASLTLFYVTTEKKIVSETGLDFSKQTKSNANLSSSFYWDLIRFVKKTHFFFEKSKPGLDSAYIILKFRFRKSYDISSIPIVIVKFKCTRKIY